MNSYAVINKSKFLASRPGDLTNMVRLMNSQSYYHFAPDWGATPVLATVYADESHAPPPSSARRFYVFDDPDVAGAGGYHDVDPQGNPYAKVFISPFLDSGGSLMASPNSVLVAMTHEALETDADPEAAEWVMMPDGATLVAKEVGDPVEDRAYPLRLTVSGLTGFVTDYVLPRWFDGELQGGKFDRMGALSAPMTKTSGGYWILMDSGGNERAEARTPRIEFGRDVPKWKRDLKSRFGRASRRVRSRA